MEESKRLETIRKRMRVLIAPILDERRIQLATNPSTEMPSDLISWSKRELGPRAFDPAIQVPFLTHISKLAGY